MVQLGEPAATGQVGGDRERRLAAEDVFDEAGEVAASADIDEKAKAVGVHGLDRLAERNGGGPLLDGELRGSWSDPSGMRRREAHE